MYDKEKNLFESVIPPLQHHVLIVGVPQDSVLAPLSFLLCISDVFSEALIHK